MTKVGLVIPVLNQFRKCVEAIESAVTQHDLEVVIVDQYNNNERPLSASWNLGIQRAIDRRADYILVINDDIIFSPWTIDSLVATLASGDDNLVMVTGSNNRGSCEPPDAMRMWPKPEIVEVAEHPDFSCFMVKSDFFDKVGTFDENFIPAYFEDNDMHFRIKLLGLLAVATSGAPYYHYGSQTQNAALAEGRPIVDGGRFEANRSYYVAKWLGIPGQERTGSPFANSDFSPKEWRKEWRP